MEGENKNLQQDKEKDDFDELANEKKEFVNNEEDEVVATNTTNNRPENMLKMEDLYHFKDSTWETLGLKEDLIKGLLEMNFIKPSKIQSTAYPLVMKANHPHLIAQSHNGSGKTGAFGIGVLSRVDENIPDVQAIIFAHTRELVNQIAKNLSKMAKYTKIKVTAVTNDKSGNDSIGQVVVITPGTFDNKFLKNRRNPIPMDKLTIMVLDEADFMITNDLTKSVSEKAFKHFADNNIKVQILFFSATFEENHFKEIKKNCKRANMIEVKKELLTLKNVRQMYIKCERNEDKITMIEEYLKRNIEQERVIIFVNTRDFTEKLTMTLRQKGYKVFLIMGGNMDPAERDATIEKFTKGEIQILITTNILARGFDERLVKLIVNFDLPITKDANDKFVPDYETYLHRIGRTGRFGTQGIGLSLVSGNRDLESIRKIEEFYNSKIEEISSMDDLIEEFKKLLGDKF
jgi:ATP-dependent RNA helicase DDX19/DBP5